MLKRHEDILITRLEDVSGHGHAYLTWSEIYRWYNVRRIDRSIWRDIKDRYQNIEGEANSQLWIYEDGHGVMLIADKKLTLIDDRFAPKAA